MAKKARRSKDQPRFEWPTGDGGKFALLAVCVLCQLITIGITWPLWQVRTEPIHLPVLPLPPLPFGVALVASLAVVLWKPKIGVAIHGGLFAAACVFDQTRVLPQVWTPIIFMAALAWQPMQRFARWYLAAMWVWAGVHKFISPEWWNVHSLSMLALVNAEWISLSAGFAGGVAASELGLGLLAIFKPKWAAFACPALHLGIALFLSPLGADWNYSVIPWNIATAIVGFWVLRFQPTERNAWEVYAAAALLIIPAGFYIGWTSPYIAHVLYSGHTPRAMISTPETAGEITGWKETAAPFPQQRRVYLQYFFQTANTGDKLHIADSRWLLNDLYYEKEETGLRLLTREEFMNANEFNVRGSFVDDRNSSMALSLAGAEMLKREANAPIYAIAFPPERFRPELLKHLNGLRNIEQIQLSGTSIEDDDLRWLKPLHRLSILSLNQTAVTDKGMQLLHDRPKFEILQVHGTAVSEEALSRVIKQPKENGGD